MSTTEATTGGAAGTEAIPDEGYGAWASQWGAEEPEGSVKSWVSLAVLVGLTLLLGFWASWAIVLFVVAIVLSVFLHELGHYSVARWARMKATEFFIGFGPRIWSFKRGETEFGLKAIPAGAYVRIIGMHNLEEVEANDEQRTYRSKPYLKRLAVILAGPAMNILLGFFILVAVFSIAGVPDPDQWKIGEIVPGTAAAEAGLEPEDQILAISGRPVGRFEDLSEILDDLAGQPVEFEVLRDGEILRMSSTLGWRLSDESAEMLPGLDRTFFVTELDGEPVDGFDQLRDLLATGDNDVELTVQQGDALYQLAVERPVQLPAGGTDGFIGLRASASPVRRSVPFHSAVSDAASGVGLVVVGGAIGIGELFSPSGLGDYAGELNSAVSGEELQKEIPAGLEYIGPAPGFEGDPLAVQNANRPVSIVGVIGLLGQEFESDGLASSLQLLALTNIFLGLINLLPLLPLDGGHAAVATYEAVRSRKGRPYRVDMTKLIPLTYAVVLVFVLLGVTSIFLDIARPVQLP